MEKLWKSVRKHPVLYSSGLLITLGVSAYSIYLLKKCSDEEGEGKDQPRPENEPNEEQDEDELNSKFDQISSKMKTQNLPLSEEQQLLLYSLFKQATAGKCEAKQPAIWDLVARAKWDSWNKLGDMKKAEAKQKYINLALSLSPKILDHGETAATGPEPEKKSQSKMMGPVFSTAMSNAEKEETSEDIWGFARDGEDQQLIKLLNQKGEDVNSTDENGRTALHWACDRGHLSTVKILLDKGAKINIQDCEGRTALHFAVDCLFEEIISELLARGALFLRDTDGQKPTDGVEDQHIKKLLETHIQNSRKTISGEDSKSFQQEKNAILEDADSTKTEAKNSESEKKVQESQKGNEGDAEQDEDENKTS